MRSNRKIYYFLAIILVGIIVFFLYKFKDNFYEYEEDTSFSNEEEDLIIKDDNLDEVKVTVDIKGAIKTPGVYEVDKTMRIYDVISLAGGLLDNADTSLINLSKKVEDEMVIIIYTKEEVANSNLVNTVIKEIQGECSCPNIENDGCLNNEINDPINETTKISLNKATVEELITINGIGEAKAKAIINYREKIGKFTSLEQLLEVDGIGESLYNKIKEYLTL